MSVAVTLDELPARVAERRGGAFLVTMSNDGQAQVLSVRPQWDGDRVRATTGATARANVTVHAGVTLLWPGDPDDPYALLVDGEGIATDDGVVVEPRAAVLHRRANG